MANNRNDTSKEQKYQEIELPVYGDMSFTDTLEDITGDLPQDKPQKAYEDADVQPEGETQSETPDEALERFRAERGIQFQDTSSMPKPRHLTREEYLEEEEDQKKKRRKKRKKRDMTDDDAPSKQKSSVLRVIVTVFVTLVFVVFLLTMGASNFVMPELLGYSTEAVTTVVSPVQNAFSTLTESVANYFRRIKLRSTLETAYEELRAENERLVYQAMRADELQIQLSQFEDIYDEITANRDMEPVTATVIAKYDGNYFSTFTINKGSNDGLEPYMAVTISGALIGYTETVSANSSTVRTIIDSEASIAGLIQSSRDQGTIRGTLGIDGTAMCRMYYLPDDHLPRPGDLVVTSGVGMSFPKGIPIGTVRESTRGMDANKQYIVVEPQADFEHIEYVIVYRYKPQAEAIQQRDSTSAVSEFVPLESARPYPTLRLGASSYFLATATPEPGEETPTPAPTEAPTPTPAPTVTNTPEPSATPSGPVYVYQVVATGPTATPTASPTPSPTPFVTYSPDDLTWEDE